MCNKTKSNKTTYACIYKSSQSPIDMKILPQACLNVLALSKNICNLEQSAGGAQARGQGRRTPTQSADAKGLLGASGARRAAQAALLTAAGPDKEGEPFRRIDVTP